MTDTESRRRDETTWVDAVPVEITRLQHGLTTAFHAFDDIERMSMPHRSRVVNDVTGVVPDAASAAARAGHGAWAEAVLRSAAECRPGWSSLCSRWDAMIEASLQVITEVRAQG